MEKKEKKKKKKKKKKEVHDLKGLSVRDQHNRTLINKPKMYDSEKNCRIYFMVQPGIKQFKSMPKE